MKHVFYVHSAITERLARAIIEQEDIDEFLILSTARYESHESSVVNIDEVYPLEGLRYKLFKNWSAIIQGDREISRLVGGEYHLYVPQTALQRIRLLLSHRLCSGFSLMEEGLLSYCTREQLDTLMPFEAETTRNWIAYLGRLGRGEFHRDDPDNVYALREEAFPEYKAKKIVQVEFEPSTYSHRIDSNDCILVCESLKYYSSKIASLYISSFVEVLVRLNQNYDRVHFKLHPDNYGTWQEALFKSLISRHCTDAVEIDRSAYLEDIAISSGSDVVVHLSSTGLYCGMFSDGQAFSFHDIFQANAVGIDTEEFSWVPDAFWNSVRPMTASEPATLRA